MALPINKQSHALPQSYRIQIGEQGERAPVKLDYIIVTKLANSSGKPRYVRDAELTKALQDYLKQAGVKDVEKPTSIPVMVIGNLNDDGTVPDEILRTEMAYYGAGTRVCYCDNFRLKTDDEADADGLSVPLDDESISSYIGVAVRKKYEKVTKGDKELKQLVGVEHVPCNPAKCPYAQGTHNITKNAGQKLCKPRGQVALFLPFAPRVGAVAKFVTTSWNSCRYLDSTLRAIGSFTNGWLAMIPLRLTLNWKSAQTPMGVQRIPIVYFERDGNVIDLQTKALEVGSAWTNLEGQIKLLSDGAKQVMDDNERPEPDLYPDVITGVLIEDDADGTVVSDVAKEAIELGKKLGKSEALIASKINSEDDAKKLLNELKAEDKKNRRKKVNIEAPVIEAEVEPIEPVDKVLPEANATDDDTDEDPFAGVDDE